MVTEPNHHPLIINTLYLIDDSDSDIFFAKRLLKRDKVQANVQPFPTVAQFCEHAANGVDFEASNSMLIVDLYLNHEKGAEAIPQIVRDYPGLMVGVSTGSEDPEAESEALRAGAWFFVGKPFDRERLEAICAQIDTLHLKDESDGSVYIHRQRKP